MTHNNILTRQNSNETGIDNIVREPSVISLTNIGGAARQEQDFQRPIKLRSRSY